MNNLTSPIPILDKKEREEIKALEKEYLKLIEPNMIAKAGHFVAKKTPDNIKNIINEIKHNISEQEFITQALKMVAEGFKLLEENAAKVTVSEKGIIKKVNETLDGIEINSLEEVCFAREYDIAKIVSRYKNTDHLLAFAEGAGCGAIGFAGLVPNIVVSTFLYFRAVQSIAMFYGYNVKEDAAELEIAGAVLMGAINPNQNATNNELTAAIGKFMVFAETTAVKQASKKTWAEMIERGGLSLLIAQIRALANAAAKKALEKAGKKGLEQSIFKGILEQLGKLFSLKTTGFIMPVLGGAVGALFDTTQMNHIIKYANIFYRKRFIEEKELRINAIINPNDVGIIENVMDITDFETEKE